MIDRLLMDGSIFSSVAGISFERVQPSSLDLTLSNEAYAMTGSLLPLAGERVRDLIDRFAQHPINLRESAIFARDTVYLARLRETFRLPPDVAAYANNKSSIGRIDVQTRVICDNSPRYNLVPHGYVGDLWLEIIPKSFDIKVRAGDALNQTIIYKDVRHTLTQHQLMTLDKRTPLIHTPSDPNFASAAAITNDGLLMTLDLDQDIVGYVAKKSLKPRPIDLAAIRQHDSRDYFEPINRPRNGELFLSQNAFYIFNTYEHINVPPAYAAEMLPYDTSAGEFRAHYAGFFDPGFGYGKKDKVKGTSAVLEVRPYEDNLIVRHRQPICKMVYERLREPANKRYGVDTQANYAQQRGPQLSKFFNDKHSTTL